MTAAKLHDDEWHFRTDALYADTQGCGAMTTGGNYKSYSGAGVWNLEMVPCNTKPYSYYILENIYVIKADNVEPNTFSLELNSANQFNIDSTTVNPNTYFLDIGSASSFANVTSLLINGDTDLGAAYSLGFGNMDGSFHCLISISSCTAGTGGSWNTIDQEPFTEVEEYEPVSPLNGFRCLHRIETGDYFEKQLGDP
jgi:hypothetical protein